MSSIKVTFSANTPEELHEKIRSYMGSPAQVGTPETSKANPKETKEKSPTETKTKKVAKKPTEKKPEVSTESISDSEPLETGGVQEPTKKTEVKQEEVEVSRTANLHPGATKAEVQAAMSKAIKNGKRDEVVAAMHRAGDVPTGEKPRLSYIKEEDYGIFLTDLEALVGE